MNNGDWNTGIIAWFARNHVAANLFMWAIIIVGFSAAMSIKKEIQPRIETNVITVSVAYPGASPREVEEGIAIKIEEAIQDLQGIKQIISTASEGFGSVNVEVESGYEVLEVLDRVKMRVDAIFAFPELAEKPVISRQIFQQQVMYVSVYGEVDERIMKEYTRQVRDEIANLPGITSAQVVGARPYEMAIEVSDQRLEEFGLTLDDVAQAVRNSSLDMPAGSIKTRGGDILLRTKGQAYTGEEFENLVLFTRDDGTRLVLGDIASVDDGFVESDFLSRFDGKQAISIRVMSVGEQNELQISDSVHAYIEEKQKNMPTGLQMAAWADISHYLRGRLGLMTKNMALGGGLVFLLLTLFLRLKVAFWVMVGIPICFLGAFALMPLFDVTLNMVSLFGFIVVLGIVVDDAIIIGESVYSRIRKHGHSLENVVRGAKRVALPALFGVLTTIAAFIPLLTVGGVARAIWESIGLVVIFCLVFSIIESKLILPAHLARMKIKHIPEEDRNIFVRFQRFFSDGMERFATDVYQPLLVKSLRNRFTTLSLFVAGFILSIGLLAGGAVRMVLFPDFAADFLVAQIEMTDGTPPSQTHAAIAHMEDSIRQVADEMKGELDGVDIVQHIFSFTRSDTSGQIIVELIKSGAKEEIDGEAVMTRWRETVGEIPGARQLAFQGIAGGGQGPPLSFELRGGNYSQLEEASAELANKIKEYEGTYDLRNSARAGIPEIQLDIKPSAEVLGLNRADLARQVRQGFYGAEAQRIQRGQDEIKVMVRFPRNKRESVGDLENMRIRAPTGEIVPLLAVADLEMGTGFSSIRRVDRQRAVTVTAELDTTIAEPSKIVREVAMEFMPDLEKRYPGVVSRLSGQARESQEMLNSLATGFFAVLLMIYVLMAIPLKSYAEPLIIMSVIPFGFIGAVFGHLIVGIPLSFVSIFGVIALGGVVVNDSLVMVDFVNKAREEGLDPLDAAREAGVVRFRPIMLTSLTTFFGLLPMLLEKSLQAQILVPMAVSLAFGIMFATVITLFLVPSLYLMLADLKQKMRKKQPGGSTQPVPQDA